MTCDVLSVFNSVFNDLMWMRCDFFCSVGMVLESEEGARRRHAIAAAKASDLLGSAQPKQAGGRNAPFRCRLLGTLISNSAYHGASMDAKHIAAEMERSSVACFLHLVMWLLFPFIYVFF